MNNSTRTPPAKWIAYWIVCAVTFFVLACCGRIHALTPQEREIVGQMKDTITELRGKVDETQRSNNSALASLSLATIQIADLTTAAKVAADQAAALAAERDGLKDKVASQAETIALQKKDKENLLSSFHTFKFWTASVVAGLVSVLVAVGIFRFMAPALNTLPGIAMAVGVPGAVGAAVFCLIVTR